MSADLQAHIERLAQDLDVELWLLINGDPDLDPYGEAVSDPRVVKITHAPTTLAPYMVALHELGHHASHAWTGKTLPRLECEALAWNWAIENSLIEPDWNLIYARLAAYGRLADTNRRFKRTQSFTDLIVRVAALTGTDAISVTHNGDPQKDPPS